MLNNQLFGPIKQWGFLVNDMHRAMQAWVEQKEVDQMMVDVFNMCAQQGKAWDRSEPYRLVFH